MTTFPEELLNLSGEDGFGYFPADINQALNGGKYHIVRKLGWGTRSSAWLVREEDGGDVFYQAAQIFTAAASKGVEERLLPVLQKVSLVDMWLFYPTLRASFWEKSIHGNHLCLITSVYGYPLVDLLRNATRSGQSGLPVHVVQYTTSVILDALSTLHQEKVMHGGVKLENVAFFPCPDPEVLEPYLAANPPAQTVVTDGLPIVLSQRLDNCAVKWDAPMREVAEWMLLLAGYGHAQTPPYTPEHGIDDISAPESLMGNPTCDPSTDIWMLGCLVFQLLTNQPLFTSTGTPAERLGEIRDVLHDSIPETWLGDDNLKVVPAAGLPTQSLEQRLEGALTVEEAFEASQYLRQCLAIDPKRRSPAEDLRADDWVRAGSKCSCCYS